MTNPDIQVYIKQLTHDTQIGQVAWTRTNPTTFSWTTSTPRHARTVIQKLEQRKIKRDEKGRAVPIRIPHYLFQVTDTDSHTDVLTIDSADLLEVAPCLEELFQAASCCISNEAVSFLKSILPSSQ